jgi:NADH dehydrogenase
VRPFRFIDRGTMATVGRGRAVAELRGLAFDRFVAWLLWLVVHVMYLVSYQNRVIVSIRWLWLFVTRRRPGLLLTPDRRDPVALAASLRSGHGIAAPAEPAAPAESAPAPLPADASRSSDPAARPAGRP